METAYWELGGDKKRGGEGTRWRDKSWPLVTKAQKETPGEMRQTWRPALELRVWIGTVGADILPSEIPTIPA